MGLVINLKIMVKSNKSNKGVLNKVQNFVGKTGRVELAGLEFDVVVRDYKHTWGHPRFLIEPKRGSGQRWAQDVKFNRVSRVARV